MWNRAACSLTAAGWSRIASTLSPTIAYTTGGVESSLRWSPITHTGLTGLSPARTHLPPPVVGISQPGASA
jgi:hypothetical protein